MSALEKRDAHDTPERRRQQQTEYNLRKMAEYERLRHHPHAGAYDMFGLDAAGLIRVCHEGWGHYSVRLTAAGRRLLGD